MPTKTITGKFLVVDQFGAWFLTATRTWTKDPYEAEAFDTFSEASAVACFNYGKNNTTCKVFGPMQ